LRRTDGDAAVLFACGRLEGDDEALEAGVGDFERGRGGPTLYHRTVGLEPGSDRIGSGNGAPGGLALESLDKSEGPAPPRARGIAVVHGELFWYDAFAFEPAQLSRDKEAVSQHNLLI